MMAIEMIKGDPLGSLIGQGNGEALASPVQAGTPLLNAQINVRAKQMQSPLAIRTAENALKLDGRLLNRFKKGFSLISIVYKKKEKNNRGRNRTGDPSGVNGVS